MDIQNDGNRFKHISISQVDAFAEWDASDSEDTYQDPKHRSQAMPQYPSLDELEIEDGHSYSKSKKKLVQHGSSQQLNPAAQIQTDYQSTHHSSQLSNKLGGEASRQADSSSLRSPSLDSSDQDETGNSSYQSESALKSMIQALGDPLDSKRQNFTPSTPYVHKFRTEMCKNYELHGRCKYGDEVSRNFTKFG